MRSIYTLLAAVAAASAAPAKLPLDGNPIADQWIAKLRTGSSSADLQSIVSNARRSFGADVLHVYDYGNFKAFSMKGPDTVPTMINGVEDIILVEPDQIVKTNDLVTQTDAPYGLARISSRQKGASAYLYDSTAGEGTYAYVIDTGIFAEHPDFEGRATFGANFVDDDDRDGDGHGTHVAGTIGSKTWGVAKKTNLIGVKVLGSDGRGSLSGVIAGLNWALSDAQNNSRVDKSVVNLSLGGDFSEITNAAITEAVNQGLFCAVAAGNANRPVKNESPASTKNACTIGAIDSNDVRAGFSNYGQLVDVFAPGIFIESTWIDGETAILSGTSMASPHVAGLGAYLLGLGQGGGNALCTRIKKLSTKGSVVDPKGSPNRIAFNGGGAEVFRGRGVTWG